MIGPYKTPHAFRAALELRLEDRARSTLDLDMSIPDLDRLRLLTAGGETTSRADMVHEHLQQAAERDLNDGFTFLIRAPKDEQTGAPWGGVRCSVEARLAGRAFARVHLDVGLGDAVLGQPDWVRVRNRPCGICGSDLHQLFVDAGLDEATASVDPFTETQIQEGLGTIMRDRTTQSKAMPLTQTVGAR